MNADRPDPQADAAIAATPGIAPNIPSGIPAGIAPDLSALPTRRLLRPVVLVGLMGVGKTTVGRKLAETLHAPFVDSDEEVEIAAQMTVPEIFATLGEPAFREGERRVIARLIDEGPRIIATGGGAFMTAATRELIAKRAISIWLRADLDTLLERTSRRSNRPILQRGDPRAILAGLIEVRHPIYAEARLTVDSRREDRHEDVVLRVLNALSGVSGCFA
ncbi:MAG: shikimate kinase [Paracoccaceae bacterium]|jgi:shikimate kinase